MRRYLRGQKWTKVHKPKTMYFDTNFNSTAAIFYYSGSFWPGTSVCKTVCVTVNPKGQNGLPKMVHILNRQYLENGQSDNIGYY